MKKIFSAVLLASFSALSLNAALIGSASMSDESGGDGDPGFILSGGSGNTYIDGGTFGSGKNAEGAGGGWVLGWETAIKSKGDWSFSFHSFVGSTESGKFETSDGNKTFLIGTGGNP